ncbi:uncharacterized protein LOC143449410 [Clavelina lepadiformis]|uniref:uncharacterized protein LOC143449410 n=1 Tax=Clavelina lepadiformis TaxID=159417 RepID=UPI00404269EA
MKSMLCVTLLAVAFVVTSSFPSGSVNRRCPKPTGYGTCGFCGQCSDGLMCCPNGCGTSCMKPLSLGPYGCPLDKPLVFCFAPPCQFASCPRYPQAKCIESYCGGCFATFYTDDGTELTRTDCYGTCPPFVEDGTTVPYSYE